MLVKIVFQDSGKDPCPFYEDVLIEWKVAPEKKDGYTWFEVSCPCLTEGRCQVNKQPCPGEKIQEQLGLLRLWRASTFLEFHPFRRKSQGFDRG
jgi:hypothetical protein